MSSNRELAEQIARMQRRRRSAMSTYEERGKVRLVPLPVPLHMDESAFLDPMHMHTQMLPMGIMWATVRVVERPRGKGADVFDASWRTWRDAQMAGGPDVPTLGDGSPSRMPWMKAAPAHLGTVAKFDKHRHFYPSHQEMLSGYLDDVLSATWDEPYAEYLPSSPGHGFRELKRATHAEVDSRFYASAAEHRLLVGIVEQSSCEYCTPLGETVVFVDRLSAPPSVIGDVEDTERHDIIERAEMVEGMTAEQNWRRIYDQGWPIKPCMNMETGDIYADWWDNDDALAGMCGEGCAYDALAFMASRDTGEDVMLAHRATGRLARVLDRLLDRAVGLSGLEGPTAAWVAAFIDAAQASLTEPSRVPALMERIAAKEMLHVDLADA